jgi:hypothetical protein
MNIFIKRTDYTPDGIFGVMTDEDGKQIAVSLEHSFNSAPKIATGTYTCVRHPATTHLPYIKFELLDVPLFDGAEVTEILIHIGNYNADSDGCILIGSHHNGDMIMDSKVTFMAFMALQSDVDSFTLTIT